MSAPTASPAHGQLGPGKPIKYSDLTPSILAVLRLERALEPCYPQNGNRSSRILAGWEKWRGRSPASPAERVAKPRETFKTEPGMKT